MNTAAKAAPPEHFLNLFTEVRRNAPGRMVIFGRLAAFMTRSGLSAACGWRR